MKTSVKQNAPDNAGTLTGAEVNPTGRRDCPRGNHSISQSDRQARMKETFRRCREEISAEDVARRYGMRIDAHGKALCVFHSEKTASMAFHGGRYHCFGCGESGSAIDLAVKLLGLTPVEAVKRLNEDFSLGLNLDTSRPLSEEERAEAERRREIAETKKAYVRWIESTRKDLNQAFQIGHLALESGRELTDREALAVRSMAQLEYWANLLESEKESERMIVFRDREAVTDLCHQILNHTPTKSGAA